MKEPTLFPKTNRIFEDFQKLGNKAAHELYSTKNLGKHLNETFGDEYILYIENQISFDGCPLSIYQKNYNDNFKKYLSVYPDADEFDFLKDELLKIQSLHWNWKLAFPYYDYLDIDPHRKNLDLSNEKKLEFILKKVDALGHYTCAPNGIDDFDFFTSERGDQQWLLELNRNEQIQRIPDVQTNEKRLRITEISKTSFKWTHNLNQDSTAINVLHSELLQNGFINSDLRVFKKAFEAVKITEQVKWTSDPVNLIYFYHLLFENNLIDGKGKKKDWKKLKYCFDYPSINEAQNLSQILNGSQTLHKKVFFENLINSILPE
ncbi:hypothetical protein [Xanthomarina gelatinilytica]|uniref:hypothetical protein n=1 Tax=Xanthomarina gelatinilytica TaxID=1137281 RepID=UPI003AA8069A